MSKYEKDFNRMLTIWGMERQINILFDCYDDEEITDSQEKAYDDFIKNIENNQELAYKAVEKYCIEYYPEDIPKEGFDNIFRYLVPDVIYIKRDKQSRGVIGFICKFKFDMENGLAVRFVDGAVEAVGPNQIVL